MFNLIYDGIYNKNDMLIMQNIDYIDNFLFPKHNYSSHKNNFSLDNIKMNKYTVKHMLNESGEIFPFRENYFSKQIKPKGMSMDDCKIKGINFDGRDIPTKTKGLGIDDCKIKSINVDGRDIPTNGKKMAVKKDTVDVKIKENDLKSQCAVEKKNIIDNVGCVNEKSNILNTNDIKKSNIISDKYIANMTDNKQPEVNKIPQPPPFPSDGEKKDKYENINEVTVSRLLSKTTKGKQIESVKEVKSIDIATAEKEYNWPKLSIDNLCISFSVIAELKQGTKLKLVDNTYLAVDNSYLPSFSRYYNDQSRDIIVGFLQHLFNETHRNIDFLIHQIRNNINIDNNTSVLDNIMHKLSIFIYKFDDIYYVYKNDTGASAKFNTIKDNFTMYRSNLYKTMILTKPV